MSAAPSLPVARPISALNAWIAGGALIVFFVMGSYFDLQISEALVNPDSVFAILGAGYGAWPFSLGLVVAGLLLVLYPDWNRRNVAIVQVVGGVCVSGGGALIAIWNPLTYLPWFPMFPYIFNVIVVVAVGWATVTFTRGVDRRDAVRVAVVMIVVIGVELVVTRGLKAAWERPRMELLLEHPDVAFSPWWSLGSPEKAELVAAGVDPDGFRSFPSAHTANAATLVLLTSLATLKDRWVRALPWLFWVGMAWTAIIGLSRIVAGAHFLTDVTVGCTITFVTVLIVYWAVFQKGVLEGGIDALSKVPATPIRADNVVLGDAASATDLVTVEVPVIPDDTERAGSD